MEEKKYHYPALTADLALIAEDAKGKRHVLLIQRKNPPFEGYWALPGGFMEKNETLSACAVREFFEETGICIEEERTKFLMLADAPNRDPRGRVVSAVYIAQCRLGELTPQAGDDASDAQWFPMDALPPLAFDHQKIISQAALFNKGVKAR